MTLAIRADVTGFFPNPPTSNESYTFDINRSIFEGLVSLDPLLSVRPLLVERWESLDERTWVFELRDGVVFSNGLPLTSADVVASIRAARERRWANSDYLQPIESVRALDERRLEIQTQGASLALLPRLAWAFVLPADVLDSEPVPVIGTGPYVLESWRSGEEFILRRNELYWGERPSIARARFEVVPDARERIARVESGEAEIADQIPFEEIPRLEEDDALRVVRGMGHRVLFLGMRLDIQPFSDPRFREAVELAIDRQALIDRVYGGMGAPASQLVPRTIVGHNPGLQAPAHDPPRARELLDSAGIPSGFELLLDGPLNRYPGDRAVLQEVKHQLAEVGLVVTVNALEKVEFFEKIETGSSPFHLLGWASETGEAGDGLEFLFHSPGPRGRGRLNSTATSDPTLDGLIDRSALAANAAERAQLLRLALSRVAELKPIVPLVVLSDAVVHSQRLAWEPPLNLAIRPSDLRLIR